MLRLIGTIYVSGIRRSKATAPYLKKNNNNLKTKSKNEIRRIRMKSISNKHTN